MTAPAIITTKEVMRRTGLSRRTLLRRRKKGKFPEPINIGEGVHGMLGYFEDEISDWVASRPRAAALNPPKTIKEAGDV
jgi:predicted DNA-binding transcriptional regulator AlpA